MTMENQLHNCVYFYLSIHNFWQRSIFKKVFIKFLWDSHFNIRSKEKQASDWMITCILTIRNGVKKKRIFNSFNTKIYIYNFLAECWNLCICRWYPKMCVFLCKTSLIVIIPPERLGLPTDQWFYIQTSPAGRLALWLAIFREASLRTYMYTCVWSYLPNPL